MSVILALSGVSLDDHEFKASLGYIVRPFVNHYSIASCPKLKTEFCKVGFSIVIF
jgi:hypothetical protein